MYKQEMYGIAIKKSFSTLIRPEYAAKNNPRLIREGLVMIWKSFLYEFSFGYAKWQADCLENLFNRDLIDTAYYSIHCIP